MSTPVSRQQAYEINNNHLDGSEVLLIQRGIGTDPTTISSMRESTHAEAPSFLCGCFTSFVNWIREMFLSCFGARANQIEAAPETAITHERLIEKGDRFIDIQFNQTDLTFPLKALVTIRFNDEILAMPHSDVAADLTEFKAEAKQMLRQVLQTQNLEGEVALGVETHFLNNTSSISAAPVYAMRSFDNGINLRTGVETGGNGNADAMGAREVAQYFIIHADRNRELLQELGRFLFPGQTTTGTV
ncbi:MAG: hypothetical protein KF898_05890 [Parachlamydiales bacterium]|nr:hypothetical protein [Candidatus Acheromyda pituitae]